MFPFLLHYSVTALQVMLFVNLLLTLAPRVQQTAVGIFLQRVSDILCTPARALFDALRLRREPVDWTPLFTIFLLNIAEAMIMRLIYG